MDLWVVGAAAAAGYIAKHWQNNPKSVSELSTEVLPYEKPESPSCPIRRLIHRKKFSKDTGAGGVKTDTEDRFSDVYSADGHSEVDAVSSSGYLEKPGGLGNYQDWSAPLGSSVQPGLSTVENMKETVGAIDSSSDIIDNYAQHSSGGMDFNNCSARNRSSLRKRYARTQYIKPTNSLESCLVAQLWNECTEMQEFVFGPLPSPSTPMRPLLVTNGSQIVSRSCLKPWCSTNRSDVSKGEKNVRGVPPLPKIGTLSPGKKTKSWEGKECSRKLTSLDKKRSSESDSHLGSIDGKALFFLGISLGVISSLVANKRELDKLKDSLKQTQNLVQDLQEELEMKDSVTVKELAANENYESQATSENFSDRSYPKLIFPVENESKELNNEKAKGPEYMSKIEAELEAELEMLGLNMNASSLEGKLSGLIELDPDFVADFAQGELKVDIIREGGDANSGPEHDDASGTSTTHSGDYAVSPRELSLRLHEVIQSRLEARVGELETALESSQRKVHQLMESEEHSLVWRLSSRELRYSSSGEESSPLVGQVGDFSNSKMAQQPPVVMNLSGEALDADNEAYEELGKTNEPREEEDDSPMSFYEDYALHKEELETEAQNSDNIASEEDSDSNEDMEELIKRIVERTKRGSPAVVNAQMMLCSMDEKLH